MGGDEFFTGDHGDVRLFVGNLPHCAPASTTSAALATSTTVSATAPGTGSPPLTANRTTTAQTTAQTAAQTAAQTTAQTPSIGGTTTSFSSTSSRSEQSAVDASASAPVDTTGTSPTDPAIAPATEQVDIALIAGAVGGSAGLLLVAVVVGLLWKWKARSRKTEIPANLPASELAPTASHYTRFDQVPLPSAADYGHGQVHSFT